MRSGDKFVAMLGFARRSGKIVCGIDTVKCVRKKLYVLAVGYSASENLYAAMKTEAEKRNTPLVLASTLESAAGGNIKAIGIVDAEMARAMLEYAETDPENYKIINR